MSSDSEPEEPSGDADSSKYAGKKPNAATSEESEPEELATSNNLAMRIAHDADSSTYAGKKPKAPKATRGEAYNVLGCHQVSQLRRTIILRPLVKVSNRLHPWEPNL
jgi:hypothetical protein